MADQEFLASFAVEIDEAGVTRLQSVLQENRDLANEVAAAFEAATAAIKGYEQAASGQGGSGEGTRDDGSGSSGPRDLSGLKKDNTWQPSVREEVRGQLMGSLYGEEGSIRDWYLGNIEEYAIATATRDAASLRQNLTTWDQAGLASDPSKSERAAEYSALQEQAYEVLSEPVAKAREYMKQALDAEAAGTDAQVYVDQVVETLREPMKRIKELYDSFTFEDDSGSVDGSGGPSGMLNLESAREELTAFRKEAAVQVPMSANASGMISAAKAAYNSIKSMFSTPVSMTVNVSKNYVDGESEGVLTEGASVKMSHGGRFSRPTDVQVAEDGDAEYIIPVKKEDRAIPLLRQLLSELSPAARASLSLGDAAVPLSGGMMAGNAGSTQITQNNSNVSAPVSIEVHASGVSVEQVGEHVYNTAERYLLRTMRSVFA